MDTDTMISALEANGRLEMPILMYADLRDIDRRIKDGDESGWRGDPTMGIFLNAQTHQFEVWGIDRGGNEYMAASHHTLNTELITKLRDGDPRRGDVAQRVLDHNAALQATKEAADRDAFAEIGEKMQWAIKRDYHGHVAVSIPRKVGA